MVDAYCLQVKSLSLNINCSVPSGKHSTLRILALFAQVSVLVPELPEQACVG